jgi:hypothetical protein
MSYMEPACRRNPTGAAIPTNIHLLDSRHCANGPGTAGPERLAVLRQKRESLQIVQHRQGHRVARERRPRARARRRLGA